MTTRIAIDLNVRVRGGLSYAGYEDASGPVAPGDSVRVYERESGLEGPAQVVEIDSSTKLIYLRVEWAQLRPPVAAIDTMFFLRNAVTARCADPERLPIAALYVAATSSPASLAELVHVPDSRTESHPAAHAVRARAQ